MVRTRQGVSPYILSYFMWAVKLTKKGIVVNRAWQCCLGEVPAEAYLVNLVLAPARP
jgi:hypothetical protein